MINVINLQNGLFLTVNRQRELLPWQHHNRYHFASYLTYITGAKFEWHPSNISWDIINFVIYFPILGFDSDTLFLLCSLNELGQYVFPGAHQDGLLVFLLSSFFFFCFFCNTFLFPLNRGYQISFIFVSPGPPRLAFATCGARSVITVYCVKKYNKIVLPCLIFSTSFPGSSLYLEKVPWLRLVTCLLDFSKFQRYGRREGLESWSWSWSLLGTHPLCVCSWHV